MKKSLVFLVALSFLTGCATPKQKAEKLATRIEKESLQKDVTVPPVSEPQDAQPQHALKTIIQAVGIPVGITLRFAAVSAKVLGDVIQVPIAAVGIPLQILGDTFRFFGEIGKFIFPPPPPKVI